MTKQIPVVQEKQDVVKALKTPNPVVAETVSAPAAPTTPALKSAAKHKGKKQPAAAKVDPLPQPAVAATKAVATKVAATKVAATKGKAQNAGLPKPEDGKSPTATTKENKSKKTAPKKAKLVRDSFTFPESDYALFAALKQKALAAGCEIKKGEIVRAGLSVLNAMSAQQLVKVFSEVDRVKTGRPSK